MSWGDLSELRAYIAEKEGKDPSEINFYRLDGEKLEPYILVRSSLDNYVFRNPAGELYILDPYSMPSSAGDGSSSRGPLREPAEGEIVIRTAEELARIGRDPSYPYNGSYILMSDIDLEGFDYYGDGTGWAPIGSELQPFTGTFDGNGFVIVNLYINRPDADFQGLFGSVEGASISNVALESVDIAGHNNIGGLAGRIRSGSTVTDSYSTGSVTGIDRVGGLVGRTGTHTHIHNDSGFIAGCYSAGTVSGVSYVGGLVGISEGDSTIKQSYSICNVNGYRYVGGFVGDINYTVVTNCYSTGGVRGEYLTGGFIGYKGLGSTVQYCYWDTETSGLTTSAGGTGRMTAEMKWQSTFVDWDFDTVWQIDEGEMYPYLRSNPQSPPPGFQPAVEIFTAEELAKIGRDPSYPLNAKYILKSNIDLSGYMSDGGWQPIGDLNNPFTGIFDGNGYTIKNLYINRPDTHYQGLFGYTRLAKVSNVTLESVSVTGCDYTGALAGYVYKSMISGSSSSGTVAGRQHVGGLLGMNDYYSELVFSYSTADITGIGSSRYTGGLVGTNYRGSYIRNCYAAGSVTGNTEVGGLVGLNSDGRQVMSNIEKTYSTGSVTGSSRIGGLVGYNAGSRVTASYWDTITSGLTTSAGGTGRTTAEMKQQSTFVDWDFDTVWQIDEGETYPYLRTNPQSPPPM
jgi:hypothetical protein